MEARSFIYKGEPIFVSRGLGSEFGTFRRSPSGGLHRVKSKDLPMVGSFEQAQDDLEGFAIKKGLLISEVVHLDENGHPVGGEPADGGQDTAPEVTLTVGGLLSPGDLLELEHLDRRLEHAARDLIRKKNEKAAAVSAFNGEIKEIEEEIEAVLSDMDAIRNKANRPQGTLPFEGDSRHETEHLDEGACNSCGHDQAAHYDEDHAPRPCSVGGCGCMAAETEATMQAEG